MCLIQLVLWCSHIWLQPLEIHPILQVPLLGQLVPLGFCFIYSRFAPRRRLQFGMVVLARRWEGEYSTLSWVSNCECWSIPLLWMNNALFTLDWFVFSDNTLINEKSLWKQSPNSNTILSVVPRECFLLACPDSGMKRNSWEQFCWVSQWYVVVRVWVVWFLSYLNKVTIIHSSDAVREHGPYSM